MAGRRVSRFAVAWFLPVLLFFTDASGARSAAQGAPGSGPVATEIARANDELAKGDYEAALKLLIELKKKDPKNSELLYDLGMCLEALHPESDAQPEAEANYREAIAANPLFPLPHMALGLMLARSKRGGEAREQLQTTTEIPDAPAAVKAGALRALARLDLQAGVPGTASAELVAALQLSPKTAEDELMAAEIAAATPDLPTAEEAYRRYLSRAPSDAGAIAALAHVLVLERRQSEAENVLRDALRSQAGNPVLTAQLATTLLASGDPVKVSQATPLLQELHARAPGDRNVTRLLARVYFETGALDEAAKLYAALMASAGENPDPTLLTEEADVLLAMHRPAEAEKLLKQAVARPGAFPSKDEFGEAATRLAFAAQEIDDPRGALQALQLRANVLPPSPASLFLEATARDALHQSSQAINLYKQFLAEAHGTLAEQESKARERIAALGGRR